MSSAWYGKGRRDPCKVSEHLLETKFVGGQNINNCKVGSSLEGNWHAARCRLAVALRSDGHSQGCMFPVPSQGTAGAVVPFRATQPMFVVMVMAVMQSIDSPNRGFMYREVKETGRAQHARGISHFCSQEGRDGWVTHQNWYHWLTRLNYIRGWSDIITAFLHVL